MRKLLGPHLGGPWTSKIEIVRKWQPPLILVLQPEVDKVRMLRDAIPGAIIIGRFYHDDSHYASNINSRPKDFAHEIHQEIVNNPVTPLLDYAQSNNETNQDWEGIQKLNEFTQEWMHLADQSGVYKCAILAFSVGNPDMPYKPGDPAGFDGRMLYWQQVLPSLNYAQVNNHILLMHAYGYPDMFHPDANWYIYRYERQVQANLRTLGITKLKYAYGEIGIDRLIVNGKGGYKVVPTTDEGYTNQTLQWEKDLQGESLLLGGAIFTAGDSGGWDTYDIFSTNVASMIATHYSEHAGDYEPSGETNDEGETIFIPSVGTGETPVPPQPQRSVDPRATQRGVAIETPQVAPGQPYWFIYEIKYYNEQEADQLGPDHHFMIDVRENNQRVVGKDVMVAWSDGQAPQKTEAKTGEEYATGFGMSPGRNAYSGWVSDGSPSEKVVGVGMGEETPGGWNAGIHTSTGVKWRKEIMAAQPAPPNPEPIPPNPTPVPPTPSGSTLVMPCTGVVTQRWGENPQDYAQFGIPGHNGLDIADQAGTPIVAIADGVVAFVGADTSYGNYVRIFHAQLGFHSFYAHLKSYQVSIGQNVKRGQQIALMGSTGNSTGNHLHLEIRLCDAQANYINLSGGYGKGRIDPEIAYHLLNHARVGKDDLVGIVAAAAREFGVDMRLFDALAREESKYNPDAVSPAGAVGLTQIMPATFAEYAPKIGATDIRNPRDNARVGAYYLNFLTTYYKGDIRKALYAYNWGPGNVDSGKTPPPETVAYANRILGTQPL